MMAANGPLKWHGGKAYLAKQIHTHAPLSANQDPINGYTHRLHPFAGGLGELWGWEHEGISESVNDIYNELTIFWRVLADPLLFEKFRRRIEATPFSEYNFVESRSYIRDRLLDSTSDSVEWAVRFFVMNRMSRQGLMKDFATPTRRIRRGQNENVSAWLSAVEGLSEWHERFKRVEVRCMDAAPFIWKYDHERAFFYCDPPYLPETRTAKKCYEHEVGYQYHEVLLYYLGHLKGKMMLSGYPNELYDRLASVHGWRRVDITIDNKASSAKTKEKKVESLWMNY